MTVTVVAAGPDDAAEVLSVVHAAFGARPVLDPPSTALEETEESVRAALEAHGGLLAHLDGHAVGALLLEPEGESLHLRRVSVRPDAQRAGVAAALSSAADGVAGRRGFPRVHVLAREELPATVQFWESCGYRVTDQDSPHLTMAKELPFEMEVATAEDTRACGERLARLLRPGDLLVLSGDLGAGKTTLTQGIGAGLGVRGDVTSPTFVISRIHPSLGSGPPLVHVDAYRLGLADPSGSAATLELDDLDLDVTTEESVTVVEWGAGVAEGLADDRLEIALTRTTGGADGPEVRTVRLTPVGARWVGSGLGDALAGRVVA